MLIDRTSFYVFFLLLLFSCLPLRSQDAYKGQIQITRRSFSLVEGRLQVQMVVDYEGLRMPSEESVTLTPFLTTGEYSLELPSLLVNGSGKQRVYERDGVLAGKRGNKATAFFASNTSNTGAPSVVLVNDRKSARRFTYRVSVPFHDWMTRSTLSLRTEECGCNGKEAGIYEDRIASDILLPDVEVPGLEKDVDVRCLSWVNFLPAPSDSISREMTAIGSSGITLNRWFALASDYAPGSAEFNDLYDLAARLFPDSPAANINAAAVALSKRDTRKARHYLSRFSTRPEAFNDMGVLCMLEGNREKAELYLEMAVAAGVNHASEVLEELRSRRNLY